jgi:hypothetical protein
MYFVAQQGYSMEARIAAHRGSLDLSNFTSAQFSWQEYTLWALDISSGVQSTDSSVRQYY